MPTTSTNVVVLLPVTPSVTSSHHCLPQLETWMACWRSSTARLCHSQMKASQTSTHTVPVYALSSVKQS